MCHLLGYFMIQITITTSKEAISLSLSLSLSLSATNEYKSMCAHCRYIQIGINPAREEEGSAA
jgi:hypothetical protein